MKAVVTGCSGFVGQQLVPALKRHGLKVLGIDRVSPRESEPEEFVLCDLRKPSGYNDLLDPRDVVFHLAAAKGDWGLSERDYYEDNVNATKTLLSVCARKGVRRHIFFSTVAVHGPADVPKDERSPLAPAIAYGRSKVAAELLYEEWVRERPGASAAVLRPSAIFGPDEPPSTNIYRLVEAIRKKRFVMVGNGQAAKSTSYIDNTVAAAKFLLENLSTGLSAFIYVDEPVLTNSQLVELVCQCLNGVKPRLRLPLAVAWPIALVADGVGFLTRTDFPITAARIRKFCTSTNFSSQKLRECGFVPPVSIEDAVRRTVEWHLDNI